MFLLVPAYPGCPGQMAVKWLLLLLLSSLFTVIVCTRHIVCSALCVKQFTVVTFSHCSCYTACISSNKGHEQSLR